MINFNQKGDFSKISKYLEKMKNSQRMDFLSRYGDEGVAALRRNTPVDTGKTANSWYYEIDNSPNSVSISFHNSNINDGVSIAIILQYGHGTGSGGYVEGRDYINPAIQPVFDRIAEEAWKEVSSV